ncbi:hypothetical protein [Streptomyces spectabilis]|uniref:Uncharacterized protein n=1 Tax=Streptomyces spectabilis TaxID=68270 RepID=A0A5P2X4L6_STRST|nr:hypothetical protein [Streptomyces spectabilis]MBB5108401.1 hypothetical protein [Streptomyces spectabilis]MCI3901154.1 hypothetical protein [Streptomyces spectabilis]QEV58644.1 hypothetical protein CP982_07845 [Streptomyces spectabilis]GGV46293.1 hypothetical protein GCM10010245_72650 [Streptomyces spectabilis]
MTVHHDPTPPAPWSVEERLRAWAAEGQERIAVEMLIEEHALLARPAVQRILVVRTGGAVYADWTHLSLRLPEMELSEGEYAFLEVVLALAFGRQVLVDRVLPLGERRLAVVLRALAAWAGADSLAVGVRS